MKIPDFFIVGAAKAGTTSLFDYLTQHPAIFVPEMKEPHYFSDYFHKYAPRLANQDEYLQLFSECDEHQLAGDLSTSYLCSVNAPRRIRELQPDARIIMVLRNPVDRAYSFYWYNRNQFVEPLGFEDALAAEPQRVAENWNFRFHYVESGKYDSQVERYLQHFGPEAVRIYLFEDLVRDAAGLCQDILGFLGLRSDQELLTREVFNRSGVFRSNALGHLLNARFPGREAIRRLAPGRARRFRARLMKFNTRRPPAMSLETRAWLIAQFEEDVGRLSQRLGRDLSDWIAMPQVSAARAER